MYNLATHEYKKGFDLNVKYELEQADITLIQDEIDNNYEVKTHFTGVIFTKYGRIFFRRKWYYWETTGYVPYEIAWNLYYKHGKLGKEKIRVNGDCSCPSPYDNYSYFCNGIEVISKEKLFVDSNFNQKLYQDALNYLYKTKHIVEYESERKSYEKGIRYYHIDSLTGLKVFVKELLS